MRERLWGLSVAVAAGLLVSLLWLPPGPVDLETPADTADYVALVESLRGGSGFTISGRVATHRNPGYPVALLALDAGWVNRLSGFVVGVSLAALLLVRGGLQSSPLTLLACWLIGASDELRYSAAEMLTEPIATALLTASITAFCWSEDRSMWRSAVAGLLHALACLTRSAVVWVGIAWLTALILRSVRERRWNDTLSFGVAFGVPLLLWSAYLSHAAGEFVPLASTGTSNLAAGLNPIGSAQSTGMPVPLLDDRGLEAFWTMAPPLDRNLAGRVAVARLTDFSLQSRLMAAKFRIAESRLPTALPYLFIFGSALFAVPAGKAAYWPTALASAIVLLAVCGYSHPILKVAIVLLSVVIVGLSKERRLAVPCCFVGFVLLTATAFGLPRFTRPFLPVFYAAAVCAVPLAAVTLVPHTPSRREELCAG